MELRVLNIKKVDSCDKLKAFADVSFEEELTVKGFRVIQDPKGPWVACPQIKYEKAGQVKYTPIVELSSKLQKQVKDKVLEAFESA